MIHIYAYISMVYRWYMYGIRMVFLYIYKWYGVYIYINGICMGPLTPGGPRARARRPVGPARGPVWPVGPWARRGP